MTAPITQIMRDVKKEWLRHRFLWGQQRHPDGTGHFAYKDLANNTKARNALAVENDQLTWLDILMEEMYEAFSEKEWPLLREELVQVAAVAVSWIEAGDTR